jgi:hypothetical protein
MQLQDLWYLASSLGGAIVGAGSAMWAGGRKYQRLVQTQEAQGAAIVKLQKSHDSCKEDMDHQIAAILQERHVVGGQMMKDLGEIKASVAVLSTKIEAHLASCVDQKQLGEFSKTIVQEMGRLAGVIEGRHA